MAEEEVPEYRPAGHREPVQTEVANPQHGHRDASKAFLDTKPKQPPIIKSALIRNSLLSSGEKPVL
jgi:hypothetical protein